MTSSLAISILTSYFTIFLLNQIAEYLRLYPFSCWAIEKKARRSTYTLGQRYVNIIIDEDTQVVYVWGWQGRVVNLHTTVSDFRVLIINIIIHESRIPTVIIRSFLLLDTLNIVGEIVMDYKRIKNQYFSNFPFILILSPFYIITYTQVPRLQNIAHRSNRST